MRYLLLAILIAGVSTMAQAGQVDRGYKACESAILKEFRDDGVVPSKTYYFRRDADMLVYYLNGTIWNEEGERVAGRATCYTTGNGRHLVEFKTEFGTFAIDGRTLVTR